MGLFNFNRKNGQMNGAVYDTPAMDRPVPDIPETLFIEKEKTQPMAEERPTVPIATPESNIDLLFQFLDRNHESKGYDDALINPDTSHLEQNLNVLKNELERTIRKVRTFYEEFITEIDFHIASRSRSGMIDTVDELKMKKDIAVNHMAKVVEIENGTRNNTGDSQGVMMSYTKGFKNGLAAISHHSILKRKL